MNSVLVIIILFFCLCFIILLLSIALTDGDVLDDINDGLSGMINRIKTSRKQSGWKDYTKLLIIITLTVFIIILLSSALSTFTNANNYCNQGFRITRINNLNSMSGECKTDNQTMNISFTKYQVINFNEVIE